ncbi:hypothetical protein I7X12_12340 [Halosimplex litoreum]|uniref:TrbL/VirB6 plasmid conjugal transfer protein n=1 Tax=Halosimplex litoreum TaxID=1198301 RepID=A0A7T3FVR4_9EURY|nr:hypothetical protein [Halosimplex litoreum]QPV61551.1 hypothetical protein I7X12_12340 [Halosimplex litoreum]
MSNRSYWTSILSVCIALQFAIGSVSAQSDGDGGGALGNTIVWAIKNALRVLFDPLKTVVQNNANSALSVAIGTPHPNAVFVAPTNNPWTSIYGYFWDVLTPLALLLWALSVGIVIFLESTSYLFSSYHRTKLKRRAFAGLLGILAWWWMDAFARQFTNELAIFLAPDLSNITLFETLSVSGVGALVTAITLSVDFFLIALVILIYFIREVVLYLFTLLMPILIALWIPGVGPFSLVSKFMKRMAGFYVPFLFMTIPVALLFRLGQILGENFGFSVEGLGLWLTALIIPIVAIVSPFVLFWQAGSIFFMAQSASRHASTRRAQSRMGGAKNRAGTVAHGGRNFSRGTQGKAALKPDGQAVFGSGESRAHAAGSRLNDAGSRLRGALARPSSTTASADTGSSDSTPTQSSSTTKSTDDASDEESASQSADSRAQDFGALRDPSRTDDTSTDRDRAAIDDEPRYIR